MGMKQGGFKGEGSFMDGLEAEVLTERHLSVFFTERIHGSFRSFRTFGRSLGFRLLHSHYEPTHFELKLLQAFFDEVFAKL